MYKIKLLFIIIILNCFVPFVFAQSKFKDFTLKDLNGNEGFYDDENYELESIMKIFFQYLINIIEESTNGIQMPVVGRNNNYRYRE